MVEGTPKLELLSDVYAICRLDAEAAVPGWGMQGTFWSITRTPEELSVVCPECRVPSGVKKEGGWRILMVEGPLDLSSTGVLASLVGPLAREGISVFALSTYDTDYLMVNREQLERTIETLVEEGHGVERRSQQPRY